MKERKDEYKPLLFTTTLRNPERMKTFLEVIAKYEGKILTNEIINEIVFDLISKKEYIPNYVNRCPDLKKQLLNDDPFSKKDTLRIIDNSPQKHKEAGFDYGWPSRFDTRYKFLKELGFVYYEMNKPIEISEAGKSLIKANNEGYEHLEQEVFLSSFAKYQRNNPFRRIKNRNKPLILLLHTIIELHNFYGENSSGVCIDEIPLFICWRDDDFISLAKLIEDLRKEYGFQKSDEVIYSKCKEILDISDDGEKRFKMSNICHEMPDEFIRKMRMTGLISIRGGGRFIDLNKQEKSKINYIIENYSDLKDFKKEREYFDYIKIVDSNLVCLNKTFSLTQLEERNLFLKWVDYFDIETLVKELNIVADNRSQSKNNILKYISEPLRLEFLVSLLLQKKFTDIDVMPNYTADDEGVPVSFASGNKPDIVCLDKKGNDVLFEVTLMRGRQQVTYEMLSIERHLKDVLAINENAFSVFLAPTIHQDTYTFSKFAKFSENVDIIPMTIFDFTNYIKNSDTISDPRLSIKMNDA